MKKYDLRQFSVEDLKEMIAMGDDRYRNQIRASKDGMIYLSQEPFVGAVGIDGLLFRLETFDAGNDYVGVKAASNAKYIETLYEAIIRRWEQGNKGLKYMDI